MRHYIGMQAGDCWGNLELVKEFREPVMAGGSMGIAVYDTGIRGPVTWKLRCDCGHEFELERASFPGKRRMRSCGRLECSIIDINKARAVARDVERRMTLGRPRVYAEPPLQIALHVPYRLLERINAAATKAGSSRNQYLIGLIEKGMEG